jgi:hypothetical protein
MSGFTEEPFEIRWELTINDAMVATWQDPGVATENGAYAIAIPLTCSLLSLTVVERSFKGTGFDWWLGEDDNLFQGKYRLEVSGILKGGPTDVNQRVLMKKKQTDRSASTLLPAIVTVVEFSHPLARVEVINAI